MRQKQNSYTANIWKKSLTLLTMKKLWTFCLLLIETKFVFAVKVFHINSIWVLFLVCESSTLKLKTVFDAYMFENVYLEKYENTSYAPSCWCGYDHPWVKSLVISSSVLEKKVESFFIIKRTNVLICLIYSLSFKSNCIL